MSWKSKADSRIVISSEHLLTLAWLLIKLKIIISRGFIAKIIRSSSGDPATYVWRWNCLKWLNNRIRRLRNSLSAMRNGMKKCVIVIAQISLIGDKRKCAIRQTWFSIKIGNHLNIRNSNCQQPSATSSNWKSLSEWAWRIFNIFISNSASTFQQFSLTFAIEINFCLSTRLWWKCFNQLS